MLRTKSYFFEDSKVLLLRKTMFFQKDNKKSKSLRVHSIETGTTEKISNFTQDASFYFFGFKQASKFKLKQGFFG